jgi:hypothetical protein
MPLVEGMFCLVEIPGISMQGVMPLPRWAVSFDETVYVARDNRLKTLPVKIARIQNGTAYVDDGVQEGDQVIVTRLVDPLENALLKVGNPGPAS